MATLATLLVTGLAFPGNFSGAARNDYAICSLGVTSGLHRPNMKFWSMLVSILLIVIGFASRVIKVHRRPSINIFGRAREWLSMRVRQSLHTVYTWSCKAGSLRSLKRTLYYRPLLAIFLAVRFLLDGWTSVGFEVGWLIVAFIWGILRLPLFENPQLNTTWTFGQVVSVLLLVAPLFTIIEYFDPDTGNDEQAASGGDFNELLSHEAQMAHSPKSPLVNEVTDDPDNPNNDWHHHTSTLGVAVFYGICACLFFSTMVMVGIMLSHNSSSLLKVISTLYMFIVWAFIGLVGVILFSLMIETLTSKKIRWLRVVLQFLNGGFFFLIFFPFVPYYYFQGPATGFYVLCALAYRLFD